MPHVKYTLAFLAVSFLFCSAVDFRTSNSPKIIYMRNATWIHRISDNLAGTVSNEFMNKSPKSHPTGKKWQVGRVSGKQYEIVNMLWRKTNIFSNERITSPYPLPTRNSSTQTKDIFTPVPSTVTQKYGLETAAQATQPSTISYIEFYYLDEDVDSTSFKTEINRKNNIYASKTISQFKNYSLRSPLFAFHNNELAYNRRESISQHAKLFDKVQAPIFLQSNSNINSRMTVPTFSNNYIPAIEMTSNLLSDTNFFQNFLRKSTAHGFDLPSPNTVNRITTPSDKIKFFEIYDSNTRVYKEPGNVHKEDYLTSEISLNDNEIMEKKRRELEQVDKDVGHGPNKIRHAKKHIVSRNQEDSIYSEYNVKRNNVKIDTTTVPTKITKMSSTPSNATPTWDDLYNYTSGIHEAATWTKYPFTAVYVYERFQVHCDAAAISSYWLIASAACLSRYREDPHGDERSAFVTYCGGKWWLPERITYVKSTQVHPRYHPKDNVRRHLYNIGVIQVVSSMASSCPNFAPVTLMSHHYVTELEGSLGSAVGWGLDRYDTSYASLDLPRCPLSIYEGIIHSNTCPGNAGYRSTKRLSLEASSNVYCLSLPPYAGEENDPVHGSILLIGGKLIALYLQEERRRWGDQSAQYTGVWRLIPWVHENAKDPADMEFSF